MPNYELKGGANENLWSVDFQGSNFSYFE